MRRLAWVLLCATGWAQEARISGVIQDSTGGRVPGAAITAVQEETRMHRGAQSSPDGYYAVAGARPGIYKVTVRKAGFQTTTRTGVKIDVDQSARIDFTLEPSPVEQSVTVSAEAALTRTEAAAVSTVVNRQFIENLPLNGRSFQSLIALTPGVVTTKATFGEQGQFSVNGQRANANSFTIDGVSANIGVSAGITLVQTASGSLPGLGATGGTNTLVSVEALEEFRVQTSSYAPEYGRMPGAQVTILTAAGDEPVSRGAVRFFPQRRLDATDWFANANSLPKPALRQHDFGGVLGGPVVVPRWYRGRDRTFFFFSYEGLRLRQPQVETTDVPSLQVRGLVPKSMRPFINAFPAPNRPDGKFGFAPFIASYTDTSRLDAASLRMDHLIGTRATVFGRYNHAPSNSTARLFALSNPTDTIANTATLTGGATMLLSPRLNAEAHATTATRRARVSRAWTDSEGRPGGRGGVLSGVRRSEEFVWRSVFERRDQFKLVSRQERAERAAAVQRNGIVGVYGGTAPVQVGSRLEADRDAQQPEGLRSVRIFRGGVQRGGRAHIADHDRGAGRHHGVLRELVGVRTGCVERVAAMDGNVWGALGDEPGSQGLAAVVHVRQLSGDAAGYCGGSGGDSAVPDAVGQLRAAGWGGLCDGPAAGA